MWDSSQLCIFTEALRLMAAWSAYMVPKQAMCPADQLQRDRVKALLHGHHLSFRKEPGTLRTGLKKPSSRTSWVERIPYSWKATGKFPRDNPPNSFRAVWGISGVQHTLMSSVKTCFRSYSTWALRWVFPVSISRWERLLRTQTSKARLPRALSLCSYWRPLWNRGPYLWAPMYKRVKR